MKHPAAAVLHLKAESHLASVELTGQKAQPRVVIPTAFLKFVRERPSAVLVNALHLAEGDVQLLASIGA